MIILLFRHWHAIVKLWHKAFARIPIKFRNKTRKSSVCARHCQLSEKSLNLYLAWQFVISPIHNVTLFYFWEIVPFINEIFISKWACKRKHSALFQHRHTIESARFHSKPKTKIRWPFSIFNVRLSCSEMKKLNWKPITIQLNIKSNIHRFENRFEFRSNVCVSFRSRFYILFCFAFDYSMPGNWQILNAFSMVSISSIFTLDIYVTMDQRFCYEWV